MIIEISQSDIQIIRLDTLLNTGYEQVHEPSQGVLVHRLYSSQIRQAKEQDSAVLSHWFIT